MNAKVIEKLCLLGFGKCLTDSSKIDQAAAKGASGERDLKELSEAVETEQNAFVAVETRRQLKQLVHDSVHVGNGEEFELRGVLQTAQTQHRLQHSQVEVVPRVVRTATFDAVALLLLSR